MGERSSPRPAGQVEEPDRLSLRLLGPARIERNGQAIRGLASGKTLALLAYLIAAGRKTVRRQSSARGQPVPREHLADVFWQDLPTSRGRANLSWTMHKISSLLPGCLGADRETVCFCRPEGCWLDLDAFERDAARSPARSESTALQSAALFATSLSKAAALYRGEFLEGLALDGCVDFELWLVGERERWRQRAESVLGELIACHRSRGACDEALRWARQLLALAPWREGTHRTIMRLLAESGRRGAALAQYEACRRALEAELGVAPAAETDALRAQIARV